MKNKRGDITFMYDAFESEVIEIDELPYILEKYQDGEIWSDDEVWGTRIFDLTNKRSMDWMTYQDDPKWWKTYIEKYPKQWEDWKDIMDNETINYYMSIYNTMEKTKYNSI